MDILLEDHQHRGIIDRKLLTNFLFSVTVDCGYLDDAVHLLGQLLIGLFKVFALLDLGLVVVNYPDFVPSVELTQSLHVYMHDVCVFKQLRVLLGTIVSSPLPEVPGKHIFL
jgi:hypothetical protein